MRFYQGSFRGKRPGSIRKCYISLPKRGEDKLKPEIANTRVAVFDLDGTLADTSADLIAAANATFAEAGRPRPLDPAADRALAFAGGRAMLREGFARLEGAAAASEIDRLYPRLLDLYGERLRVETVLYEGADAALRLLAAAGGCALMAPHPAWQWAGIALLAGALILHWARLRFRAKPR